MPSTNAPDRGRRKSRYKNQETGGGHTASAVQWRSVLLPAADAADSSQSRRANQRLKGNQLVFGLERAVLPPTCVPTTGSRFHQ